MKNLYQILAELHPDTDMPVLATLVSKSGSAPQVPGSSAIFSATGLSGGTLGGGILEAQAAKECEKAMKTGISVFFDFDLNADISVPEGAICGGQAGILIDASPLKHLAEYKKLTNSLRNRTPGILITAFQTIPGDRLNIRRQWHTENDEISLSPPFDEISPETLAESLRVKKTSLKKSAPGKEPSQSPWHFFLEPVFPYPRLIIAGAGHIGKALTHIASLLDFSITVIDDRPDLGSHRNLPEADEVITGDIGHIMEHLDITPDTFIVIVTRGHVADAEVLKACITKPSAYTGMIGSRRKTGLMRKKFMDEGWATPQQWERIHAPVGLEIGSVTVQEIAVSIAAELVQVRRMAENEQDRKNIWGIVLAAGESKRMGTPKMLLSYGENTIIETVLDRIESSGVGNILVVTGAGRESLIQKISDRNVEICVNPDYTRGMYSSVKCGFGALPPEADAVIVFLGDQPMVRPELIDRIIKAWKRHGNGIVIPVYGKKRGHPVLIDARYRDEVLNLDPQNGLRSLMMNHSGDIYELETEYSWVLRDIDTASDYQRELTKDV